MPFKSENQRRFMWANHPDIAEKWAHGEHSTPGPDHKMPSRKRTTKSSRKFTNRTPRRNQKRK